MILVVTFVILMFLGLPLFGVIGLATVLSMIGMPFPMEFIPQNLYTGMDQFSSYCSRHNLLPSIMKKEKCQPELHTVDWHSWCWRCFATGGGN